MEQEQQQDRSLSSAVSFCPSFNCYSTDTLVDTAYRVVSKELNDEKSKEDEIDEFEFVSIGADVDSSRLFSNGEIRQVFPLFNRGLLLNNEDNDYDDTRANGNEDRHVAALKKLFIDDDDDDDRGKQASSSSSSDEDEPERKPNAIFCIWSPKRNPIESSSSPSPSQSPSRCKKSNSTGSSSSSKKWFKFRDLLKRSNSDGKDSFVFLNKPKSNKNNNNNVDSKEKKVKSRKAVSAHEAFYVKNRASKEGDKKKSYLPYKQDLLGGFF